MNTPGMRAALILLFPLALSACVGVGPDVRAPKMMVPERWASQAGTGMLRPADWWTRLKDPVLNKLVADAIGNNTDVATAKARIREARATFAETSGRAYPDSEGSANYTRSRSAGTDSATMTIGLKTSWDLDLFGGQRRASEAAWYSVLSADERLHAATVALIGDLVTGYAELRGTQARIAVARRNAGSQQQTVRMTRDRLAAGEISQLDLLNAETQAETTASEIPDLRIQVARALNRLALLSGRPVTELAQQLDPVRPLPDAPASVSAGLPADLLRNRPDVRAAERDYASATARIGQKQALLYPEVSLTGSITTGGASVGDLSRASTIGWNFGPGLTIPLFNAGKLSAGVEAAKAARDQSFIGWQKAVLTALSEVENASVSYRQNQLLAAQLEKIVVNNRKINTLTLDQYQAGARSFADVLTAQRALLQAENSLTVTKTALLIAWVDLQRALGGGWNGELNVRQPAVADGNTGPHRVRPADFSPPPLTGKSL